FVEDDRFQEVTRDETTVQIRMDSDHATGPVVRPEMDGPDPVPGSRTAAPGDEGPDLAVEVTPVQVVENFLQIEVAAPVPEDDPTRPSGAADTVEPGAPVESHHTPAEVRLRPPE